MSYQRQGATRTVEESLRKWNGESREAARGFHSLTLLYFFARRRPCGGLHPAPREPIRRRRSALDRLARRHATSGRSRLTSMLNSSSPWAALNVQVSSETLRLVPLTRGSVMSSQRQGATRTVEESLRKRNGESREADRGFHSLSCCIFWAPPPLRRPFSCALGAYPAAQKRLGSVIRRFASNGRSRLELVRTFIHNGVRLDVDAGAGELGGQAGILALLADRQRKLVVGNQGTHRLEGLVDHECAGHLRG
ncbi:MAG: hypothetical protein QOH69_1895 [Actinomycetota bacterium]|nr:hypothetical protein [Actinomycetota bacterium]